MQLTQLLKIFSDASANCGEGQRCDTGLPVVNTDTNQLQGALAIIFGIAAALAVLMLVIAGFRFVTAQGDPGEVSKAKATIVYSLIGLLIAVTAEGIVAFTLGHL